MSRTKITERQLEFLTEFLVGVGFVEDWRTDQRAVPVRFSELTLTIDTSRGNVGEQFTKGINQAIERLEMLRRDFYSAQIHRQFPDGPIDGAEDDDEDDDN